VSLPAGTRIAVVHEWLLDFAGSERVLKEILALYPQADLFALVEEPDEELKSSIPVRAKRTTFIRSLPNLGKWLPYYVPLMPYAIETLDLSRYDLVISNSHAVAKGVITGPDQLHIGHVCSPMRYAWDLQHQYLRESGLDRGLRGLAARWSLHRIRQWDVRTANGVDAFVAISRFIARRIRKCYRRESEVIYPPVDVSALSLEAKKDDFYLTVSRLQPYKRVDLLVDAFAQMPEKRLVVIGDGPEMRKLRARAGPNVALLGYRPTDEVREHMRRARAFLFAGVEDFGIVMVEAQACGTPVIALGRGGAAEIVRGTDGARPTGAFFFEQSPQAVKEAVTQFEAASQPDPAACRENALRFDTAVFRERFGEFVARHWKQFEDERASGVAR
jgi:glycosyltransferase involved in cell wall biosynthesis